MISYFVERATFQSSPVKDSTKRTVILKSVLPEFESNFNYILLNRSAKSSCSGVKGFQNDKSLLPVRLTLYDSSLTRNHKLCKGKVKTKQIIKSEPCKKVDLNLVWWPGERESQGNNTYDNSHTTCLSRGGCSARYWSRGRQSIVNLQYLIIKYRTV